MFYAIVPRGVFQSKYGQSLSDKSLFQTYLELPLCVALFFEPSDYKHFLSNIVVPEKTVQQYEDNMKWIKEANKNQLVIAFS